MKLVFIFLVSLTFIISVYPQIENRDQLLNNTVYNSAPGNIKKSRAFVREWNFFQQRAFPNNTIPSDGYSNALLQRSSLRKLSKSSKDNLTWVSLGPTSGYFFAYGNVSSRIVTGAYNPINPQIIYIGAADGGVWKSTDAGSNWKPLTDNQPSMAMGSLTIDPVNPEIIYAGTGEATYSAVSYYGRGLLKSTDGGASWTQITSGLPSSTYFSRLIIRPYHSDYLLAALGTSGLYASIDTGKTWTRRYSGRCDDVVFSPSGDTAFATGSGFGLIRSIDGGNSFSTFGSGLPVAVRMHLDLARSNPSIMFAANYTTANFYVYKSTDYGATWSQLVPAFSFDGGQAWYDMYCKVNPLNPDNVFIGTIDVYRSTDGGNSFSNITKGSSGGNVHVDQHFVFFHPSDSNSIVICNDGGVWKSSDGGDSFINMNQNLTLTQFYRISSSPFDPGRIIGGTQDNGTQQTFSTINWQAVFGGDGGQVCFNPFDQDYILAETQNGGLMRTTNGGTRWLGAASGIDQTENVTWIAPIIAHPNISGQFYTARQKVYITTNNGSSWTPLSLNSINGTGPVREMAISKTNPSVLFASSANYLFKSTDGGINWSDVSSGLPVKTITSISVHPANPLVAVVTLSGFGSGHVYKTTDGGATWSNISGNLPDSPANTLYIHYKGSDPAYYFVGTDVGIFYSTDDGISWTESNDGLPNCVMMYLDYQPLSNTLRVGTHGRGVYEAYIDAVTPVELSSFAATTSSNKVILNWNTATETNNKGFEVQRKLKNMDWAPVGFVNGNGTSSDIHSYSFIDKFDNDYEGRILYRLKQIDFNGSFKFTNYVYVDVDFLPKSFTLFQNYPNPFNPSTAIKYFLTGESNVNLTIYNSVGQKVEELVNKVDAGGFHEIYWNADKFSSGIYYYTLKVFGFENRTFYKETKKMQLIK
ncbi:MAG: T9SS type A sorting domain-containing protein [Ignavibacteriaceae bacterium]|nr:T9SS type A sorting domain-containing protein [Ignavibacteriaceae bacterium]